MLIFAASILKSEKVFSKNNMLLLRTAFSNGRIVFSMRHVYKNSPAIGRKAGSGLKQRYIIFNAGAFYNCWHYWLPLVEE